MIDDVPPRLETGISVFETEVSFHVPYPPLGGHYFRAFGRLTFWVSSAGSESVISNLAEVNYELGIIAGTRSINPLSPLLLKQANDSVVTVESTRLEKMTAHIELPVIHNIMMRNNKVIDNTIHFLKTGQFIPY